MLVDKALETEKSWVLPVCALLAWPCFSTLSDNAGKYIQRGKHKHIHTYNTHAHRNMLNIYICITFIFVSMSVFMNIDICMCV